jgi:hypothetical protein
MPDLSILSQEGILSSIFGSSQTYEFGEYPYFAAFNYILQQEPKLSFKPLENFSCKFPDITKLSKLLKIISDFTNKHKETLLLIKNGQIWKDVFSDIPSKEFNIPFLNDCVKLGQDLGYDTIFNKKEGIITTKPNNKNYKWYDEKHDFELLSEHGIKSIDDLRKFIDFMHILEHDKWSKLYPTIDCSPNTVLADGSKRDHLQGLEFTNPLAKINYLRAKTYLQFMFSKDIYYYLFDMFYFSTLELLKIIFDVLTNKRVFYKQKSAIPSKFTNSIIDTINEVRQSITSTTSKDLFQIKHLVDLTIKVQSENLLLGIDDISLEVSENRKAINEAYKAFTELSKDKQFVSILSTFKKIKDTSHKKFINDEQNWCTLYEFKGIDALKASNEESIDEFIKHVANRITIRLNKIYQTKISEGYSIAYDINEDPKQISLFKLNRKTKSKTISSNLEIIHDVDPIILHPEYFIQKIMKKLQSS